MSVYSHVDGLGVIVEACIADTVLEYRKANHRSEQTIDTIAEHIRSVETSVNLRPAGLAIITVTVEARRLGTRHVECFRALRMGDGQWECTASSLHQPKV